MSHCIDYWRKWKREGNFCGLRKQDADANDAYLSLVEKISGNGTGLESDFVFEHFTAGAARPLLRCKDEDIQTRALNYVVACLKRSEDITGGDLDATIRGFMGKDKPAKITQMRTPEPEKNTIVLPVEPPQTLAQKMAEPAQVKESPFKTAAEVLAHEKDPLGVASMFPKDTVEDIPLKQFLPAKTDKELFMEACQQAYEHGKPDFKQAIDELQRYHPSWNTPGTVIYFCVTNPKEAIAGLKK